jgi:hypothetical protein
MNKAKWEDRSIPLGVLIAKLAEECGEVANVYADAYMQPGSEDSSHRIIEELSHVQHIAYCIRQKITHKGFQRI